MAQSHSGIRAIFTSFSSFGWQWSIPSAWLLLLQEPVLSIPLDSMPRCALGVRHSRQPQTSPTLCRYFALLLLRRAHLAAAGSFDWLICIVLLSCNSHRCFFGLLPWLINMHVFAGQCCDVHALHPYFIAATFCTICSLGSAEACPGSTCISPVWLERCNLSLSGKELIEG